MPVAAAGWGGTRRGGIWQGPWSEGVHSGGLQGQPPSDNTQTLQGLQEGRPGSFLRAYDREAGHTWRSGSGWPEAGLGTGPGGLTPAWVGSELLGRDRFTPGIRQSLASSDPRQVWPVSAKMALLVHS